MPLARLSHRKEFQVAASRHSLGIVDFQCASGWLNRWNEEFELLVHDPEHETMTCVLMNKSNVGADEEIGRVEVRPPLFHQQATLSCMLGINAHLVCLLIIHTSCHV